MIKLADFSPRAGIPLQLAQDLTLVLAPNASPMTGLGTNTFLLGRDALAVIDPGPDDPVHLCSLLDVIAGRKVSHIFVTHSHLDHSPLARALSRETGGKVYAFGPSDAGRSPAMQALAASQTVTSREGVDDFFQPDITLQDNSQVVGDWGCVRAIHTPGHMANHLSFRWKGALFCGDHVMAWSTSLISPPDGDLTAFMDSCEKLLKHSDQVFYPAHGAPVYDPEERLAWLVAHRKSRGEQILGALIEGPMCSAEITRRIYTDVPLSLQKAAQSNVLAHLLDLHERKIVTATGPFSGDTIFAFTPTK